MNPEEKDLLRRTLQISEENNLMLKKLRSGQRWSIIWGVLKIVIFLIPFVVGYLYLEPYLGSITETYGKMRELFNSTGF